MKRSRKRMMLWVLGLIAAGTTFVFADAPEAVETDAPRVKVTGLRCVMDGSSLKPSPPGSGEDDGAKVQYAFDKSAKEHVIALALKVRDANGVGLRYPDDYRMRVSVDGRRVPPEMLEAHPGYFGRAGLRVALVFDQSYPLKDELPACRRRAKEILSGLDETDRVCILAAGSAQAPDEIVGWVPPAEARRLAWEDLVTAMYANTDELDRSLDQVRSARVRDAIAEAVKRMPAATATGDPIERRLVVVMSTMYDDASVISTAALKEAVRKAGVNIVIACPMDEPDAAAGDLVRDPRGVWTPGTDLATCRSVLEAISAPHLGLVLRTPASRVAADGLEHAIIVEVSAPGEADASLDMTFTTAIADARTALIRVLEILIPTALALAVLSALIVFMVQRRREGSHVSVDPPTAPPGGPQTGGTQPEPPAVDDRTAVLP